MCYKTLDKKNKHYKAKKDCIITTDGLLDRKTMENWKGQRLLAFDPRKACELFATEQIQRFFKKSTEITRTKRANLKNYYHQNMAHLQRKRIVPCEQCKRDR